MKTLLEGSLAKIPLRLILDSDEIKYRPIDKDHVNSLSKDIEEHGLDVPIIVWNGGGRKGEMVELEDGKTVPASYLVAGGHRRAALRMLWKRNQDRYKELFPEGVPVIVRSGEIKDVLAAQLRENVARRDMTNEEVFPIINRLRDEFKMKNREIAKAIAKSDAWVSQVFDIGATLGDEAEEELSSGSLKLSHAREAARKVKAAKKAGKPVSAKEELAKVKAKAASTKAKGRQREERRLSARKLYERYLALPRSFGMGKRVGVLEEALGYLAGAETCEDVPAALATEPAKDEE